MVVLLRASAAERGGVGGGVFPPPQLNSTLN